MSSAQKNIIIDIGSDFYLKVTHRNPDRTPINLSGCSAVSRIRENYDSPIAICDIDITITPATGVVEFRIPNNVTSTIERTKLNNYVWDYKLTDSLGYVKAILFGNTMARGNASGEDES